MSKERPTFSPFWHRVRALRPRLRPYVEITRQHYRGRRWHVVHDPSSNQFYRLSPVAHEFVCSLDGKRTVEEAWELALTRRGDEAPTQNEIIQLIGQLYNSNLLFADVPPETEQLLRRGRDRKAKKLQQQALGIMYFRIRMFNPDRILTLLEPIVRPILNRWGLLAWCALVIYTLTQLAPHWERLVGGFDNAISPSNWGWLIVVFVVTKAIHESGHGLICKRFGGQVPEFGMMLLVLFPAPYVDASSCWAFASKWQRLAVGAGGMLFELAVAAIAGLVWIGSADGSLVKQISYNAMLTASISTILFNANPLMRFDGYYMLADLTETPNLMQRSMSMLKYLMQKHVYRLKDAQAPTTLPGEAVTLLLYGLAAMVYRVFLFITITLFVMGKMFGLGLVLAIWTAGAWFIIPFGKLIHWHTSGAQLTEKRTRAWATTLGLTAAVIIALGMIPAPDKRRGDGVIVSESRSGVFFGVNGFVEAAHAQPGDRVQEGDPIATLTSPGLLTQRDDYELQLEGQRILEREAIRQRRPSLAQNARRRIEVLELALAEAERRIGELTVRAPQAGVLVGPDPHDSIGAYVERGQQLGEVVDPSRLRVVAVVGQGDAALLFDQMTPISKIEAKLVSNVGVTLEGDGLERIDAGQVMMPHESLTFAGGGALAPNPEDQTGRVAKEAEFLIRFDLVGPAEDGEGELAWLGAPGERVRFRLTLPNRPLLSQWVDRFHKAVQGRVKL